MKEGVEKSNLSTMSNSAIIPPPQVLHLPPSSLPYVVPLPLLVRLTLGSSTRFVTFSKKIIWTIVCSVMVSLLRSHLRMMPTQELNQNSDKIVDPEGASWSKKEKRRKRRRRRKIKREEKRKEKRAPRVN